MKRDYEIDENNEKYETFYGFRIFRYFRLFRNLSSSHMTLAEIQKINFSPN